MKTLLTLVLILFVSSALSAQSYTVGEDNKLVRVKDSTKTKKDRPNDINKEGLILTDFIIEKKDKAGRPITYLVYQGKKGGYFIIRRSKKTGKEYKQYVKIQ